jgi:DNA-binding NtrC family response regulator
MGETRRTILIVDDEPQILRLVEKMIGPHRARVVLAASASEALRICESEAVDILISDVRMPEMDGIRLAERVLKNRPEPSVLLISGQHKDPPAAAWASRIRFLKKPFFPSDLVRMIEEIL